MRILIADDEPLALSRLLRLLNTLGYTEVDTIEDATHIVPAFLKQPYDLVFLDINMPHISGLEVAYALRHHDPKLAIIFQTAYASHALEAFNVGAMGYLVKPFSIEDLKKTIARIVPQAPQAPYILSKNGEHYYMLKPQEIFYIKADLTEVMLRTVKGFSYYAQKISDVQTLLEAHGFVRIHRSYLINLDAIKSIQTVTQSKLLFSFKEISDQIESSKDGAKAFREQFGAKATQLMN